MHIFISNLIVFLNSCSALLYLPIAYHFIGLSMPMIFMWTLQNCMSMGIEVRDVRDETIASLHHSVAIESLLTNTGFTLFTVI